MLEQVANVDCSYNLTPEELYAKVALSDALVVRSATKVRAKCGNDETVDGCWFIIMSSCVDANQCVCLLHSCRSPGRCLRLPRAG